MYLGTDDLFELLNGVHLVGAAGKGGQSRRLPTHRPPTPLAMYLCNTYVVLYTTEPDSLNVIIILMGC